VFGTFTLDLQALAGWLSACDVDTVADLQIIAPALERRGYSAADVELIMNVNWVRVLRSASGLMQEKPPMTA
jgi:microsomal dipeptidase-like Zn-dependent dipeptidase